MTHTYHISGMTCKNCKASVEKSLAIIPNVSKVVVNLEKKEVLIYNE